MAVRFVKPEWDQYAIYAAWAGLALRGPLHARTVARDRRLLPPAQRAVRRDRERQRPRLPRHPRRGELPVVPPEQAVGPDGEPAVHPVRSDGEAAQEPGLAGEVPRVRQDATASTASAARSTNTSTSRPRRWTVEYIDADKKPVEARQYQVQTYGTVVIEYKGRTERVTSAEEQDLTNGLVKVLNPQQEEGLFPPGPRREAIPRTPSATATARVEDALARRQLRGREARARAGEGRPRRRLGRRHRGTEDRPAAAGSRHAPAFPAEGRARARADRSARREDAADARARGAS